MKLTDSVSTIPLIGPKYAKILAGLGVEDLYDFLTYYPRTHFDSSKLVKIEDLRRNEKKAFRARINTFKSIKTRKRGFSIQTAVVEDESEQMEVVWFNQPYLEKTIKEGSDYIFIGKLNPKKLKPQVLSPEFEEIKEEQTHVGIISPIYPLTQGISNKWLRSRMKWLIDKMDYINDLKESYKQDFLQKYSLMQLKDTIKQIHFPDSQKLLKDAKYRLGFDELLKIQKQILKREKKRKNLKAKQLLANTREIEEFVNSLPYKLTKDQETACEEILKDLKKGSPARRLLSGDVGSGKTIVAMIAALNTALNGSQSIVLAPTTVLARQHFETFSTLLNKYKLKIKLITANSKYDKNDADILIGTHAILSQKDKIISNKLAFLIIDEQHRFGVKQRGEIQEFIDQKRSTSPHTLSMTATPIPRTLALTLFSDMQVSSIKSKPQKRKTTKTHLVPPEKRENAYKWIKQQIRENRTQVFWIAPLIEENEAIQAASIRELEKEFTAKFKDFNISTLHGKLSSEEKDKILEKFRNFEASKQQILLSTSVIEVGIDIPRANIIVIEGAERFGLAQLHQLRGRVGRAEEQGWCFLFTSDIPTDEQAARLKYFSEESDGFKIAEYDLHRRGPGEVYGTRQAGIPNLRFANLFDLELIKATKKAAKGS
ncbi:ATP-dependent DNA helicase RecG [Candidatus Dojkabacteria bacterium]|nr:ATP-dependent DNA helicase RecG [Candidatus Dojkabacteria bacterium]